MPNAAKPFRHGRPACTERRGSANARGYGYQWRKASKAFLAERLFCAECDRHGRDVFATQVDHIKPHRGNMDLFWDMSNWQPLCASCGGRKSALGQ
jgi:5-methylcytosine-specific restriction enzyme A